MQPSITQCCVVFGLFAVTRLSLKGLSRGDACKKAKVIIVAYVNPAACGSNTASSSLGLYSSASIDLLHKACLICVSGEPDLPLMHVSFLS